MGKKKVLARGQERGVRGQVELVKENYFGSNSKRLCFPLHKIVECQKLFKELYKNTNKCIKKIYSKIR